MPLLRVDDDDAADDALPSCIRRARAVFQSSGAASAVVLGPRGGHAHAELSVLDRRCLVIVNVGPATSALPSVPLTLGAVAPGAPALTAAWPRRARPIRRKAREKVLRMYVRRPAIERHSDSATR